MRVLFLLGILFYGCAFVIYLFPVTVNKAPIVNVMARHGLFYLRCGEDPNFVLEACEAKEFINKPDCSYFLRPYGFGIVKCNTGFLHHIFERQEMNFNWLEFWFFFYIGLGTLFLILSYKDLKLLILKQS